MDFFRNLASKPDHIKAYYSFAGASILTGLVALIWVSALPARFSEISATREMQDTDTPTPIGAAKDGLANVITATGDKTNSEESALGSLGNNDGEQNSMMMPENNADKILPPQEPSNTEDSSGKVILIETKPSEKREEHTETPPPSRTILIATTTVQKSE